MGNDQKMQAFKEACEWLEQNGYEAYVRDDYSGRGMGGDKVPAIISNAPGTMIGFAIGIVAGGGDLFDPAEVIPTRSDGFGRDALVWY